MNTQPTPSKHEYENPQDYTGGETILADAEVLVGDNEEGKNFVNLVTSLAKKKEKESHSTDSISYRLTVATNKLTMLEESRKEIGKAITEQMKKIRALKRLEKQLEALNK